MTLDGEQVTLGFQDWDRRKRMEQNVTQKFLPAIKICTQENNSPVKIKERVWLLDVEPNISDNIQNMGYMGQYQIEEVWKHYYKDTYVSNYGYVVKIKDEYIEEAKKVFSGKLLEDLKSDNGKIWLEMPKEAQKLIFENSLVPFNRVGSGCKICLNMTGKTPEYDIHRIIAKKFLEQEEGKNTVHHIDNNSYNNNVTNLIWLSKEEHDKNGFRTYHPMSKRK